MTNVDVVSSRMIDIGELDWAELVPGVQAKRVWADPATNRAVMFVRFAAGAQLPRHAHEGDELVYVLEGTVADDYGAVTAGSVGYRPNGCTHTVRSPRGATALAVVTGRRLPGGRRPRRRAGVAGVRPGHRGVGGDPARRSPEALLGRRGQRAASPCSRRFEPGAELPAHRHVGDELVFVIEGTVEDEAGALRPGVVGYRPNGCAHTVRSPNGATVLGFLWGGVEPI